MWFLWHPQYRWTMSQWGLMINPSSLSMFWSNSIWNKCKWTHPIEKPKIAKTDHRSCFRKGRGVFKPYDICFFVSWSFMSEMTVGLFRKHRALDELHNPGIPHYPEPSEEQNPQHRCVYHASAHTNIPYITAVELLLQSHGHLILLACFVGFSSIQFLIIPFQTTKQTSLPKTPR